MIIQNNEIKISARFWPIFCFELSEKRSRAELKILQLELWLEPARLRLITSDQLKVHSWLKNQLHTVQLFTIGVIKLITTVDTKKK